MKSEIDLNPIENEVIVANPAIQLNGILAIPKNAKAVIVFAHGSDSGRFSPRNNYVARVLQKAQFATLLMDLLTEKEVLNRANVFDIMLLAQRLRVAKQWLAHHPKNPVKIGYFGASTGAAAALVAAAEDSGNIFSVVSRGGRPDLAEKFLPKVLAPTLLIVGGNDTGVIELNQAAFKALTCPKEFSIIPGATHLFEERGTLEMVAKQACDWFTKCVGGNP